MELEEAIKLGTGKLAEFKFGGRFIPELDTYIKSTNHNQHCWICGKQLARKEVNNDYPNKLF